MPANSIFNNPTLIVGMITWVLGQTIKLLVEYFHTRRWNWALLFSAGGMPSSHSALMASVSLSTGIYSGFNSPIFGLAIAVALVVIYDATGIRRQAGMHAQKINLLINELFSGQPISEKQLIEVLGHSPRQAFGGIVLGLTTALLVGLVWR
jgi:acid phosphatase family membrane protein YuiD